ncbi:MAG: hypothetical protein ACK4WM_01440 [Thermoflexales bacterium]
MQVNRACLLSLTLVTAPTLVYVLALWLDPSRNLVLWERALPKPLPAALLSASLVAHAALSVVLVRRLPSYRNRSNTFLLLTYVVVAGLLLQIAATHIVEPYPLRGIAFRQYSNFTGGYFSVGVRVEHVGDWLKRYAEEMPSYNVHAQRHPPGLALIFWASKQAARLLPDLARTLEPSLRPLACFELRAASLDAEQILAGLIGIILESTTALLVPVMLFGFIRRVAGLHAAALAALLYPMTSGVLMWVSQWNRAFGLFSVGSLWLVEIMLTSEQRRATWAAFGLGVLLGLAAFMSFGNLPIAMIAGTYAAVRIWVNERLKQIRWRAIQATLALAGVAATWLPLIASGFDAVGTYRLAMQYHLALKRDYFPFVLWHAWDIFTFAGLPLALAGLVAWRHAPALTAAWFLPLVAQCLLHVARGETGRVWMYFAPLIVASAAIWLSKYRWTAALPFVIGLLVIQTASQASLLRVISYGIDPLTVQVPTLPENLVRTNTRFESNGEVRLLGYSLPTELSAGETATLHLFWQLDATKPLAVPRKVFVHVTDQLEDRERIVNQDGHPANWALPTTCWLPGQIIHDPHTFTISESAAPGTYYVLIGLYDELTGERAFVHTADIAMANAVALPQRLKVRGG